MILIPSAFEAWGKLGLECDTRGCTIIHDPNSNNPKEIIKGVSLILPIIILVVADASILWKMRVSFLFKRIQLLTDIQIILTKNFCKCIVLVGISIFSGDTQTI